jgi:Na+-driven multidrug efflux pump
MGVQMTLGAFVFIKLISPFGTTAVAAHTIWQRIDMVLMMPIMALGMGAGVLAGQNLGARKPDRAVRSGWIAALIAEGFMLIWALVIFLIAEHIVRLFNTDPGLVDMGSNFLRIACVYYTVFAFAPVFQNCIAGSGDTLPPMILSIVGTWVLQIPLALLLLHVTDWGVYSIRWAMTINAVVGTSGFIAYYISGRWKKKML